LTPVLSRTGRSPYIVVSAAVTYVRIECRDATAAEAVFDTKPAVTAVSRQATMLCRTRIGDLRL
jgi:hypothetical protein